MSTSKDENLPGFMQTPAMPPVNAYAHHACINSQGLREIQSACHGLMVELGWWIDLETGKPKERDIGGLIALIHSELSEALEAIRKNLKGEHLPHRSGVEEELADTIIRIFDLAGHLDLDLASALYEKLDYNAWRHDHKLEHRRNAKHGKKF